MNNLMSARLLATALLLSLVGCAGVSQDQRAALDPWVGRPANDLIVQYGPPEHRQADEAGGTILIYEKVVKFGADQPIRVESYGDGSYTTVTPPRAAPSRVFRTMFFVDPAGKI
jgi:hypothetical protein